jgi:methionyl aminopeptidase
MIIIKNKESLRKMEEAGKRLSGIFEKLHSIVKVGISTLAIDTIIAKELAGQSLISCTKGYRGYRHVSCISVNDEVVHGVPNENKIIHEGEVVKIDVCASWNGYCADMARPYIVGAVDTEVRKLIETAQNALDKGIEKVKIGNYLTDISAAIQWEIEKEGFGIVRDFAGHGIGKKMHEDPEILNYVSSECTKKIAIRQGMAFAIEPMVTLGNFQVYVAADGWTVKTKDKSMAAHVEDTVIVTDNGAKVITRF